jgi:transcriptional regulator of acetoin/glycerol metabolism
MTTNQKKSGMATAAKSHASAPAVNSGRHEAKCTICSHSQREQVEAMFLRATTQERGYFSRECRELGVSRYAMYRHAHATGLMKA